MSLISKKRNLDALESGEFSIDADRVVAKKSKFKPTHDTGIETIPIDVGVEIQDVYVDEDMMDIVIEEEVELKQYDPTENIQDAILTPQSKDGTLNAMRKRAIDIIQIMNAPGSKKYLTLWLQSLCEILYAVTTAAERSATPWHLTETEKEDFKKIADVMRDIAMIMPLWQKMHFPTKALHDVENRFYSVFRMQHFMKCVLPHFCEECIWGTGCAGSGVCVRGGFFDDELGEQVLSFWRS